jgi:hypothetical protein
MAHVAEDRTAELLEGYATLQAGPFPDGLMRTELLQGPDGQWRIQTLWRDRAALLAMRSSEEPAAPRLFRQVGADPTLTILDVAATISPGG